MDCSISHSSSQPIYEQIVSQIKSQIIAGKLKEGEALPSIRVLARELRISVITTKRAYDELEAQGLLRSVAGKGTFVAAANLSLLREEQLRQIEELLQKAVDEAKVHGISLEEMARLLTFIYRGES
ncbi:MAG: GntR family transcriptional regulator [Oscillospiraceae bacterium]|nr:GntR family transcriptional regulator [Oscillospiraceae bacterium]